MIDQLLRLDLRLTQALCGSDSLFIDTLALTATSTATWLFLALAFLYMVIKSNHLRDTIVIILALALCVLLADQIASGIFKPLVARYRPAQDPTVMHTIDIVAGYRGGRYGFFSSHAANTMALALCSILLVRHRLFSLVMCLWVAINCWTRLYLGVHYVSDILVGLCCGLLVGGSVYALLSQCLTRTHRYSNVDIQTSTGYAHTDIALFISSFLFTCLYCIAMAFTASV